MNKKVIIVLFSILAVIFIAILLANNKNKEVILECNSTVTLVDGESSLRYIFHGKGNTVSSQELFVKMFIDDEERLNSYNEIIKDNSLCKNIVINNNFISYECFYDLSTSKYYEDLENKDGNLLFSVIKEEFEKDNYICSYK